MTPTEREAATARLSSAFGSYLESQGDPAITYQRLDELARIAIEQGVVPVWKQALDDAIHRHGNLRQPWDAVCPEEK